MPLVLFNPLSGPGSDGNEGVLRIPQSSSITGTSPSDCSVSYPGHSLGWRGLIPLQRCSQCILQPQQTGLMCVCEYICIYIHTHIYKIEKNHVKAI